MFTARWARGRVRHPRSCLSCSNPLFNGTTLSAPFSSIWPEKIILWEVFILQHMIASLHVRSVISDISLKRSYKPSLPLWVYESKRCNLISKNSLAFKDGVYIYTCYLLLCICCIWLRSVHVQYGKTYKRWDTKINFVPFISKIKVWPSLFVFCFCFYFIFF